MDYKLIVAVVVQKPRLTVTAYYLLCPISCSWIVKSVLNNWAIYFESGVSLFKTIGKLMITMNGPSMNFLSVNSSPKNPLRFSSFC